MRVSLASHRPTRHTAISIEQALLFVGIIFAMTATGSLFEGNALLRWRCVGRELILIQTVAEPTPAQCLQQCPQQREPLAK